MRPAYNPSVFLAPYERPIPDEDLIAHHLAARNGFTASTYGEWLERYLTSGRQLCAMLTTASMGRPPVDGIHTEVSGILLFQKSDDRHYQARRMLGHMVRHVLDPVFLPHRQKQLKSWGALTTSMTFREHSPLLTTLLGVINFHGAEWVPSPATLIRVEAVVARLEGIGAELTDAAIEDVVAIRDALFEVTYNGKAFTIRWAGMEGIDNPRPTRKKP